MILSIIVPVYNIEKYLSQTIDSILNQDYKDIELILVNDGSTDGSLKICKNYQKKDARVKVINQKNAGVSWATYNGYKAATGKYIAFADHDDILLPGLFSHLMSMFEKDVDMTCCSRNDLYDDEIEDYTWQGDEVLTKVTGREALENTIKTVPYNLALPLWGRIYRKSYLDKIDIEKYAKQLPTIFMVDIFVMPFMLLKARNVKYTNKVLYIHREVRTSISRSGKLNNFYFEMIDSFPILFEMYKANELNDLYSDSLRQYMKTTLQRMWYKLNKDKVEYTDKERLLKKIDEHFNQYYDDLKSMSLNFIDKISFNIFKISKKLWTNTIGTLYFSLIRKIKYR